MHKKDYEKAASIVRGMSQDIPAEFIRPLPEGEGVWFGSAETAGIAVWTTREAFVTLLSKDNPNFDADRFRTACINVADILM